MKGRRGRRGGEKEQEREQARHIRVESESSKDVARKGRSGVRTRPRGPKLGEDKAGKESRRTS